MPGPFQGGRISHRSFCRDGARGRMPTPTALVAAILSRKGAIYRTYRRLHRFRLQAGQEFAGKPIVMRLTGRQREPTGRPLVSTSA